MARRVARIVLAGVGVAAAVGIILPRLASADGEASKPAATAPATVPTTLPATTLSTTAPASSQPVTSQPITSQPATAPATLKVAKGTIAPEVKAEALFQPVDPFEVKTNFKAYGGPLVVVAVAPPNALVRKDQSILSFDRTWIDWAVAGLESELAVSKSNLAKLEIDQKLAVAGESLQLRQAEDGVKIAEGQKKWFEEVDGPQMLLSADLTVKQAQHSVDDQSDELDQLKKMYQGEELTAATADIVVRRAVRALEQGKIVLKMQQERRDKVKAFDYPFTRQRTLDAVEPSRQQLIATKAAQDQAAVARSAAMLAAKVAVEQATKKLADVKEDAAQFQFKASADGILVYGTQAEGAWVNADAKLFKIGEKVPAGQVLMRVYQPGKLRLSINLPETQAFWVEQGQKAKVMPAATPLVSYEGRTSSVELASKPNIGLAFVVNIDIENADARLVPGMKAAVTIDAGKTSDVLVLPVSVAAGGRVQVKLKDGIVADRTIKLGKTDGQWVEIKSGVEEGDEVIKK